MLFPKFRREFQRVVFFLMTLFCFFLVSPLRAQTNDSIRELPPIPQTPEVVAAVKEAKAFLREHLKAIGKTYPFEEWEGRLQKAERIYEKLKRVAEKRPPDAYAIKGFNALENEMRELRLRRPEVQKLINEMYVQVVAFRVEELAKRQGREFPFAARQEFLRQLRPYEAGSLQPKTSFLAKLYSLDKHAQDLRTSWTLAYAENFLQKRVQSLLTDPGLQKAENFYDTHQFQTDYWKGRIATDALQSEVKLKALLEALPDEKKKAQDVLARLLEALKPEMLFSDLLEHANKEGVSLGVAIEEQIETSLRSRQSTLLAPIESRLAAWNILEGSLRSAVAQSGREASIQRERQYADEEMKRREEQRLAQLKAEEERLRIEQERIEREQKEQFRQTLMAVKNFTVKTETSVELDDESKRALGTKAGFIKSSYVGSGQKKLKVGKQKFSDTLAFVEKFAVAEGSIDLSKLSLEERTHQSAYVYTSPEGRTTQEDLVAFVGLVALGSFGTGYQFFSYSLPQKWRPGTSPSWRTDKAAVAEAKDREFSYVDLVVDAHRKRSGGLSAGESRTIVQSVNLPPNMIVIFDAGGGIRRFESFSDVGEIVIQHADLDQGRLHYKFLNYGVDRENIYLNGIDPEIKIAIPGV